jgi:hypothetical protein
MKMLILCILALALIGCTPSVASNVSNTNVNSNANVAAAQSDYQKGMEDGVRVSTVVLGQTICDSMKASPSECVSLKGKMTDISILSVRQLKPSSITELAAKDNSYRASLKSGAAVFALAVGDAICSAAKTREDKCKELQVAMGKTVYEFINLLSDAQLNELKNSKKFSNLDLVA